ncbi:hypothetical protein ADK66_22905 [Micromonospora sp. NRRL B-16802]|nr:hypothetical protein ADK66_22905 [Micromonospora sp. NRRL B-16802]
MNKLKFIEPHRVPVSCVVAYTNCRPLYGATVKSFNDTQPDLGCANTPVDDHRYVDGRLQGVGGGVVGGGVVGGGVVAGGVVGGGDVGGGGVGPGGLGTVPPVHVTPLRAKLDGTGLLLVHDPLKPNEVEPLVGIEPL